MDEVICACRVLTISPPAAPTAAASITAADSDGATAAGQALADDVNGLDEANALLGGGASALGSSRTGQRLGTTPRW